MRVTALRDVAYGVPLVTHKTGEEFEMENAHVFPFEVMGHVERCPPAETVDVEATEHPKGRTKRAKE